MFQQIHLIVLEDDLAFELAIADRTNRQSDVVKNVRSNTFCHFFTSITIHLKIAKTTAATKTRIAQRPLAMSIPPRRCPNGPLLDTKPPPPPQVTTAVSAEANSAIPICRQRESSRWFSGSAMRSTPKKHPNFLSRDACKVKEVRQCHF